MANQPNESSAPTWKNWSGNLVHVPPTDGTKYYHMPHNQADLKEVIATVKKIERATLRVSGQRHSQPPLVTEDNRDDAPATTKDYIVDLACYADLGPKNDQRIILGPGDNQVTINTGVREDELDAFLTQNNLMMETVTAGGFFSLGGMTAVDVHGATVQTSIFADTVSEFNIMTADGSIKTINTSTPKENGWSPIQFARVSLGGLGIVTSIVLNVLPRPFATTLQGGISSFGIKNKADFIKTSKELVEQHDRMEFFFTPYATSKIWLGAKNFVVLWWNVDENPTDKTPNSATTPDDACVLADKNPPEYGAKYLTGIAKHGATIAQKSQYSKSPGNSAGGALEDGIYNPAIITAAGLSEIESQGKAANKIHSDLWLDGAVAVIFMSYFVPLPNFDEEGLGRVWESLDVVSNLVLQDNNFHIAAPMEYRFVKACDTAMTGVYSENPDTWFVSLDLIGFVEPHLKGSEYNVKLLKFFAEVERYWVGMGGIPHNGKMYGFYDPMSGDPHSYSESGPFNPNFLTYLRRKRGAPLIAFDNYRKTMDPDGLFYNKYLQSLLES